MVAVNQSHSPPTRRCFHRIKPIMSDLLNAKLRVVTLKTRVQREFRRIVRGISI